MDAATPHGAGLELGDVYQATARFGHGRLIGDLLEHHAFGNIPEDIIPLCFHLPDVRVRQIVQIDAVTLAQGGPSHRGPVLGACALPNEERMGAHRFHPPHPAFDEVRIGVHAKPLDHGSSVCRFGTIPIGFECNFGSDRKPETIGPDDQFAREFLSGAAYCHIVFRGSNRGAMNEHRFGMRQDERVNVETGVR